MKKAGRNLVKNIATVTKSIKQRLEVFLNQTKPLNFNMYSVSH